MRILYVTQVDLDAATGAARHVIAVTRELATLGHDVTLLAPGTQPVPGVRHRRPPAALEAGVKMELALSALVLREVARRRPDAAYVRISASTSAVPAALAGLRVPVVLELNGPILDELANLGRSDTVIAAVGAALAGVIRTARTLVVPLPSVGTHARDALGAEQVVVVANGADLDAARPGDRAAAREALGLPTEPKMIGLVANLAPELRMDLLAEAHRKLAGVALLVVGDGAQRGFVDAMAMATRPSSPVLYLGKLPHPQAVRAVQAVQVCVNVRDGCLGTKSLEYAAVGRRQVAFDTEGADRIAGLYPGLDAVHLVAERSAVALRAALEAALDAELSRGPLPDDAVAAARANLGWDQTARDLVHVIDSHL